MPVSVTNEWAPVMNVSLRRRNADSVETATISRGFSRVTTGANFHLGPVEIEKFAADQWDQVISCIVPMASMQGLDQLKSSQFKDGALTVVRIGNGSLLNAVHLLIVGIDVPSHIPHAVANRLDETTGRYFYSIDG